MKKLKFTIFFIAATLISLEAFSQSVLRNEGTINVTGGYVNLQGSYQNESLGEIILDGTLSLTGNYTNNIAGNVIGTPGTTAEIIFAGTTLQTIGGSTTSIFYFPKLTVNSGAIVEVTAGKAITAYGNCAFNGQFILRTTTGQRPITATFIDNGTITGNISSELSYYGTGTGAKAGGRTWYLSPPISNATSGIFNISGANTMAYYNTAAGAYVRVLNNTTPLNAMQGYEFRSATSQTFTFTGTPNTGPFSNPSMSAQNALDAFYLMGNPYPSVLDWDLTTRNAGLYNTLWYRTMNTSNVMVFDTWNGSVGTNNNGTANVDGKIPPMQAFWVSAIAGQTGSFSFDNSARTHNWGSANFIKSSRVKDFEAFRIAVYGNGNKDEQIIMQSQSGRDSMDRLDAFKMFVNLASVAEIYTLSSENKKLVIQDIAPIAKERSFPLALKVGQSGNYKLLADFSESSQNYTYTLEDKLLNTTQDLNVNPEYNFKSEVVNDTSGNRFIIHVNKVVIPNLGTIDLASEQKPVLIYASGKQVFIKNCPLKSQIFIYDILGRMVYETTSDTDYKVINTNLENGYYMVKLVNNTNITTQIIPISL
jgi:hypothetical protein